jgi:hypothetical protein
MFTKSQHAKNEMALLCSGMKHNGIFVGWGDVAGENKRKNV